MLQRMGKYTLKTSGNLIRFNYPINESILIKNYNGESGGSNAVDRYSQPKITRSVLEPLEEDISHVSPYLKPTFNFAAYINKSDTLQQLLKLNVNFHKIEANAEAVDFILGINFDEIKGHIIFLNNLGLAIEKIGYLISKNPLILKEDSENLKIRINYLKFKKFTNEMITRIIEANPFWLTYSTQEIDNHLGYFQNQFQLTGDEVRQVVVKCPKLITTSTDKIKVKIFVFKEEMGFTEEELKKLLLNKPLLYIKGHERMLQSFEYLHRNMNISLERIVEEPEILTCRKSRLMERHLFLVKLDKAQFDPKKPNYVALTSLVSGSDSVFCTEIAKSSIQAYNAFLKSI